MNQSEADYGRAGFRRGIIEGFRCSATKRFMDVLGGTTRNGEDVWWCVCDRYGEGFPRSHFIEAKARRGIFTCECGREVNATPSNLTGGPLRCICARNAIRY
jgi:hypothetical protein